MPQYGVRRWLTNIRTWFRPDQDFKGEEVRLLVHQCPLQMGSAWQQEGAAALHRQCRLHEAAGMTAQSSWPLILPRIWVGEGVSYRLVSHGKAIQQLAKSSKNRRRSHTKYFPQSVCGIKALYKGWRKSPRSSQFIVRLGVPEQLQKSYSISSICSSAT